MELIEKTTVEIFEEMYQQVSRDPDRYTKIILTEDEAKELIDHYEIYDVHFLREERDDDPYSGGYVEYKLPKYIFCKVEIIIK